MNKDSNNLARLESFWYTYRMPNAAVVANRPRVALNAVYTLIFSKSGRREW